MPSHVDSRSRVTVVGVRRRVDLALPTSAPIGEYVAAVAELCGQNQPLPLPASWSLATAGTAALPIDASLASAGIVDGAVLYLRDLAHDPGTDPVVEDVDELVADQLGSGRRASTPAGQIVIVFGLMWTVAVALLTWRYTRALIGPAVALAVVALLLVAAAWSLHQRPARVPAGIRLAVALAAVPCLAVAGARVAEAMVGSAYGWCGAVVGANVAALLALAAIPEGILIAVEVQLAAGAMIVPLLVIAQATPDQAAAAVVLLSLSLLGLSKLLAASIAVWVGRPRRTGGSVSHVVTSLLLRTRRLLVAIMLGPAVALAIAFIVLGVSGDRYAIALAVAASVALLVRARQRCYPDEVILIGGAGVVGLFAVGSALLTQYVIQPALVGITGAAGLVLLGAGALATMVRPTDQPESRSMASPAAGSGVLAGTATRPDRLRFIDVIGVLCNLACASLALGVFGVFSDLVATGRSIIG